MNATRAFFTRDAISEAIESGRCLEAADRCIEAATAHAATKPSFAAALRRHAEQYRRDAAVHRLAAERAGWRAQGYSESQIILVMRVENANEAEDTPGRECVTAAE